MGQKLQIFMNERFAIRGCEFAKNCRLPAFLLEAGSWMLASGVSILR